MMWGSARQGKNITIEYISQIKNDFILNKKKRKETELKKLEYNGNITSLLECIMVTRAVWGRSSAVTSLEETRPYGARNR